MKKGNGGELWSFAFLIIISIQIYITKADESSVLVNNECLTDSIVPVCYSVSYYETNCKMIVVELAVNGVVKTGETSIESIMGGGSKKLLCQSVLGQSFCIVAKNVVEDENGYSVCFATQVKLVSSVVITHDIGCYQVSCAGTCSVECKNGGFCQGGICHCPEGYYGEDCAIEVKDGCVTSPNNPKVCANVTENNCNYRINFSAGNKSRSWIPNPNNPDKLYCSQNNGCDICFFLSSIAITKDDTSFCLSVQLSCLDNSTYQLECYSYACPGNCAYSSNDYIFSKSVSYSANITKGSWAYGYFEQDATFPVVDLSISGTVKTGILRLFERWNCRPTAQFYDKMGIYRGPMSNFSMEVIPASECSTRLSQFQMDGKFYFGFYCSPEGENDCRLSNIRIDVHFLEILHINEKSLPHPVIGNSVFYFEFTPSYYPINVTISNQRINLFPSPAKIYFNVNQCASKASNFAAITKPTHVSNGLQTTENYTLTIDPTGSPYLVGQLVSIYVDVTSSCSNYLCSTVWAIVEATESASLPSVSDSYEVSDGTKLPPIGTYQYSDGTRLPPVGTYDESSGQASLPPVGDSSAESDGTKLPPIGSYDYSDDTSASSPDYSDGTKLPPIGSNDYSDGTKLPPIGSHDYSDGTKLPPMGSYATSDITKLPPMSSQFPSTNLPSDQTIPQSSSSTSQIKSSTSHTNSPISTPTSNGSSLVWIISGSVVGVLLLVVLVLVALIIVKLAMKKKKKHFFFDEDGLLGADEEDDL